MSSQNNVDLTDGRVITATTLLTLETTTSMIVARGELTLNGGTGIVIHDNLMEAVSGKPLVIDSDYQTPGDGILTVAASKTIDGNNSDIIITAWDLDLDGKLKAGTAQVTIHGSKIQQTIGLGDTSKDLHISSPELQRLTADGLT